MKLLLAGLVVFGIVALLLTTQLKPSAFGGYARGTGELPFAATPRDFAGYMNTLDWGPGRSVKFSDLSNCEGGPTFYYCISGFVVIKDPTGTRTCELAPVNSSWRFGVVYGTGTPKAPWQIDNGDGAFYNTGRCKESPGWF